MADHNQRRCQDLPRSSRPQVFLGKGALKICSKFTGKHGCGSEIKLLHGCSPVNLLHIFRTSFPKNTSGGSLLYLKTSKHDCVGILLSFFSFEALRCDTDRRIVLKTGMRLFLGKANYSYEVSNFCIFFLFKQQ